jgi:hypothetical protein
MRCFVVEVGFLDSIFGFAVANSVEFEARSHTTQVPDA